MKIWVHKGCKSGERMPTLDRHTLICSGCKRRPPASAVVKMKRIDQPSQATHLLPGRRVVMEGERFSRYLH